MDQNKTHNQNMGQNKTHTHNISLKHQIIQVKLKETSIHV